MHGDDRGFRGEAEDAGAVRLRVPDAGATVVHDLILGEVSSPNSSLDDPLIARADGTPLYNLAVAVDDLDAGITLVVRGNDHLTNTAKQLLVFRALGVAAPEYAHLPADPRTGREEVLQAPRGGLGPGAARRRVPPGGGPQLPRPARVGLR